MTETTSRSRRAFLLAAGRAAVSTASASLIGCMHRGGLTAASPAVARTQAAPLMDEATAESLGTHAAARSLLYGCAVNAHALATDPGYAKLIRQQCRIVVGENSMKWAAIHPTGTTFRFEDADALVAFAELHGIKVRGHNLVWHRDNPDWLNSVTAQDARAVLANHIETVAGRYAGRMHSWDVVNEAIEVGDGRPDGLRQSIWLRLIGEDYIEFAFRAARAADPQALLTYNDFGIEAEDGPSEARRQAILLLVRRMVTRRIPIDAVGIQSHIQARQESGAGLRHFIAAIRELGLQVFVTEMDVNDRGLPDDQATRDLSVAVAYKLYLDLVLADPAVRAVLTWGITDRYTWLDSQSARAERCLPFDADFEPAAAFIAMRNAFDRRPTLARS